MKTNFDGKGFKTPSSQYLDFVRGKRSELYSIWFTTTLGVVTAAIAVAAMRGHASPELLGWIVGLNLLGVGFFYGVSALAK